MKVLVLQSELGILRGGGENFTKNLFAAFANRGHRVSAAFVSDGRGRYPLVLPSNLEPIPIPGWWSMNFGQATLASVRRHIPSESCLKEKWDRIQEAISWRTIRWHRRRFQQRIGKLFRNRWGEFDAAYVHSNIPLACIVARHLPTVLRLPGPVTEECAVPLRTIPVVCANGDALVRIRKFLGDHAVELPIGIDTNEFTPGSSPVRSNLRWSDEHRVIGYVGRLSHIKGIDILATAFQSAVQSNPSLRLIIIGSGPEEQSIRSYLSGEITRGLVHLERDIDHEKLCDWYRAMDLMIMPSRYENFSNAIIEGMACGIPFLASGVGGNILLAQSGAGWLFESESVISLGTSINQVLKNRSEINYRGRIGHRYVRRYHSWSVSAGRLEEIILSCL